MQIAKTFSDDKLWAHELAAYAEDDWSISDAFRLNVGLRLSPVSYTHLFGRDSAARSLFAVIGWRPLLLCFCFLDSALFM